MKLIVKTNYEDSINFSVLHEDGRVENIKTFSYDDHGSRGMQDAGSALENLAKALGAEVEYQDADDEED